MPLLSWAQTPEISYRKLGLEAGLSHSIITDIIQDSSGFMWIGTGNGLNRYDGLRIVPYLAEAEIIALACDNKGMVWASTQEGLYSIAEPWLESAQPQKVSKSRFMDLTLSPTGELFGVTVDTLFRLPEQGNPTPLFWDTTSLPSKNEFLDLAFDQHGDMWLCANAYGVIHLGIEGQLKARMKTGTWAQQIQIDNEGAKWIQTQGSVIKIPPGESTISQPRLKGELVSEIASAKNSYPRATFFAGKRFQFFTRLQQSALLGWDRQAKSHFLWGAAGLNFSSVRTSYVDLNGLIWLGTTEGVIILQVQPPLFNTYLATPDEPPGYMASMRGITEDDSGRLYLASYQGLFRLDKKSRELTKIKSTTKGSFAALDRCYDLILEDSCLYCASESFGFLRYDPKSGATQNLPQESNFWTLLMSICRLQNGDLWLGANKGLYCMAEEDSIIRAVVDSEGKRYKLVVFDMCEDPQGMLWIGSDRGLFYFDPSEHKVLKTYSMLPGGEEGPAIFDILPDKDGSFWLGTQNQGLIHFNPENGQVQTYTTKSHGLPSDHVVSIIDEQGDVLWLGTFKGLVRFEKRTGRFKAYFEEDGLSHSEFNHKSAYMSKAGLLYFGGLKGINEFDPQAFRASGKQPDMLLTRCLVYDHDEADLQDKTTLVQKGQTLVLGPSNPFFILHFSLVDYLAPNNIRFAYKIPGTDSEWQDLGFQRSLRLGHLLPGSHEILIRGFGNSGIWSEPLRIRLEVHDVFYRNPLFLIVAFLVGVLLVVLIYRVRIRLLEKTRAQLEETVKSRTQEITDQKTRIEQQANKLQSLDRIKSRFFANISHELRTPLTLINGHLWRLLEIKHSDAIEQELTIAHRNGKKLSSLVEQILDLSRIESGTMKLHERPLHLPSMLSLLADSYRSYTSPMKIDFVFEVHWEKETYHLLDSEKVSQVVQNFLSNATKFTPEGGQIRLIAYAPEAIDSVMDSIRLEVTDTGKGIAPEDIDHVFERFFQTNRSDEPAMGGAGIGLALCKELAQLMHGSVNVKSEWGQGSSFFLEISARRTSEVPGKNNPMRTLVEQERGEKPLAGLTLPVLSVPKELEKQTILVVEDHPEMRAFIVASLPDVWTIQEAGNGEEAIEILQSRKIDLVISDIMMPKMDGFQLLEAIRSNSHHSGVSVMMLTARAALEDKIRVLTKGIDDYLVKPFNPKELQVRVLNILKNRHERKQWQTGHGLEAETEVLSADQQFVLQAEDFIQANLANAALGVIDLAEHLLVSQRTLTRKIRSTTGLSPLQFIREIRLQAARAMLENTTHETVSEIRLAVGISDGSYFAKIYHERFGKMPSEYF